MLPPSSPARSSTSTAAITWLDCWQRNSGKKRESNAFDSHDARCLCSCHVLRTLQIRRNFLHPPPSRHKPPIGSSSPTIRPAGEGPDTGQKQRAGGHPAAQTVSPRACRRQHTTRIIGNAGGSIPIGQLGMSTLATNTVWLATNDSECNSRMAANVWLKHAPTPANQIHATPTKHGASQAAVLKTVSILYCLASVRPSTRQARSRAMTKALPPARPTRRIRRVQASGASRPAPAASTKHVRASFSSLGNGRKHAVAVWRTGSDMAAHAISPSGGLEVFSHADLLPQVIQIDDSGKTT